MHKALFLFHVFKIKNIVASSEYVKNKFLLVWKPIYLFFLHNKHILPQSNTMPFGVTWVKIKMFGIVGALTPEEFFHSS